MLPVFRKTKKIGIAEGHASGVKEGHASGIKEGLARGIAENQRSIAVNILTKGMDVSLVCRGKI